jgi:hypothetical protein
MITDKFWVSGGIGIGVLTTTEDDAEGETGLGLDFRAGVNLLQSAGHALNLALEVTPGFFEDGSSTGISVQLGWQSF